MPGALRHWPACGTTPWARSWISAITYAELRFGVEKSRRVAENLERLERFLLPLEIVPFDAKAAQHYGRIRTELRRRGVPIGANDLLIAAHALSLGVCLVTSTSASADGEGD